MSRQHMFFFYSAKKPGIILEITKHAAKGHFQELRKQY